MNQIYKVIWSRVKHCYVVVSEIAGRCGKTALSSRWLFSIPIPTTVLRKIFGYGKSWSWQASWKTCWTRL